MREHSQLPHPPCLRRLCLCLRRSCRIRLCLRLGCVLRLLRLYLRLLRLLLRLHLRILRLLLTLLLFFAQGHQPRILRALGRRPRIRELHLYVAMLTRLDVLGILKVSRNFLHNVRRILVRTHRLRNTLRVVCLVQRQRRVLAVRNRELHRLRSIGRSVQPPSAAGDS